MTSLSPIYSNNPAIRAEALASSSTGLKPMEDVIPAGDLSSALPGEITADKTSEFATGFLEGFAFDEPMLCLDSSEDNAQNLFSTDFNFNICPMGTSSSENSLEEFATPPYTSNTTIGSLNGVAPMEDEGFPKGLHAILEQNASDDELEEPTDTNSKQESNLLKRKEDELRKDACAIVHEMPTAKKPKKTHQVKEISATDLPNITKPGTSFAQSSSGQINQEKPTKKNRDVVPLTVSASNKKPDTKSSKDSQSTGIQPKPRVFNFSKKHLFINKLSTNPFQVEKMRESFAGEFTNFTIAATHFQNQLQNVRRVLEGQPSDAQQFIARCLPYLYFLACQLENNMAGDFPLSRTFRDIGVSKTPQHEETVPHQLEALEQLIVLLQTIAMNYQCMVIQMNSFKEKPDDQLNDHDAQAVLLWMHFDSKAKKLNEVVHQFYQIFCAHFPFSG